MFLRTVLLFLSFFSLHSLAKASPDGPLKNVEHHYADSNGVTIHFVRKGQGHPVLMIHGFPDYGIHGGIKLRALVTNSKQ